MREIKFRVWSGNMWLDGNDALIHVESKTKDKTEIELIAGIPFKQYVMCQYTGLKDRKGKEIYEGDVVRYKVQNDNHYIGEVSYDCEHGGARFTFYTKQIGSAFLVDIYGTTDWEVIGNIYENPELVEALK